MLLDPTGGIVMTNDGNAILREVSHSHAHTHSTSNQACDSSPAAFPLQQIQVQHPAAKSMIEISRTQDEEVGDGTTSVIILGEEEDEKRGTQSHDLSVDLKPVFVSLSPPLSLSLSPCHLCDLQPVRCWQWLSSFWSSRCIRL